MPLLPARHLLQRVLALVLALVVTPLVLSASLLVQERPVRLGEAAPRTVLAPQLVRVVDHEATDRARRVAAENVDPVLVDDAQARAAIVQEVRDVFAVVNEVRAGAPPSTPGVTERGPSAEEQVEALGGRLPMLDEDGLRLIVALSDEQLELVRSETVDIAQELARQRIREQDVRRSSNDMLQTELVVRPFPSGIAEAVVAPIIRAALRPTVRVDVGATAAARRRAAAQVEEVVRTYPSGSVIVQAGETVGVVELAALEQAGVAGVEPWRRLTRAFALAVLLTLVVSGYVRSYRQKVWRSARRLVLLAALLVLYALALQAVALVTGQVGREWLFVLPAGAVAMLATILFEPPIAVLAVIPVTVLTAFSLPNEPGVVVFAGLAALGSVPLVTRLSARKDLRRAAWQSTLGYAALAPLCAAIFGQIEEVPVALAAGFVSGALVAVMVNGSLPFLESVFGILTTTSLLDLADRNHPLLRELEQKALGSYNHSIMVSTMAERAARSIGADHLLVSVAALYHDIGKVRRPWFFVENQFGTGNPHDDLTPEISAVIIQEHVTDGIEMSRTFRLPPEIVEGIATHHGTTLVTYFYRQALAAAHQGEEIDEEHFRYKGRKPASREMAILMLADCCEGASRAAAMENRNLTRADLELIVRSLVAERVDDGQLDDAALTFRELRIVQESFIETLVGVYHPRIPYPDAPTKRRDPDEPPRPARPKAGPRVRR